MKGQNSITFVLKILFESDICVLRWSQVYYHIKLCRSSLFYFAKYSFCFYRKWDIAYRYWPLQYHCHDCSLQDCATRNNALHIAYWHPSLWENPALHPQKHGGTNVQVPVLRPSWIQHPVPNAECVQNVEDWATHLLHGNVIYIRFSTYKKVS